MPHSPFSERRHLPNCTSTSERTGSWQLARFGLLTPADYKEVPPPKDSRPHRMASRCFADCASKPPQLTRWLKRIQ